MPRLAVYIVPDRESGLYQLASSMLGWDVFAERVVEAPDCFLHLADRLREWVGPAHCYGFHATIGDALEFTDSDVELVESRLAEIARETEPFRLTGGRIHRTFRSFPRALAATFDSPDGAIQRLEERVVTEINTLHSRSPIFTEYADQFHGLARDQLITYGSPMVRSLFDLHFTLASGIPNSEVWRFLMDRCENGLGLFRSPTNRTLQVNAIHLLEMRSDARYRIRQSYDLTGGLMGSGSAERDVQFQLSH